MVLPAGTTVPPLAYAVPLLLVAAGVGYGLYRAGATLTERMLLALGPWMVGGAALYVTYQLGALPTALAPLCSSPAVYVSTVTLAGAIWLGTLRTESTAEIVAAAGAVFTLFPVALALEYGARNGTLAPTWPAIGLGIAAVLAPLAWLGFDRLDPEATAVLGWAGLLAVFGHLLDGVSTAIGVDVLGFGEQTPLSRLVMDTAGALPTASLLGVGWLFVLVKLAVSVLAVWLLAGYLREDPGEGYPILLVVIAVGLGPGAHNLLLFTALGPAGI